MAGGDEDEEGVELMLDGSDVADMSTLRQAARRSFNQSDTAFFRREHECRCRLHCARMKNLCAFQSEDANRPPVANRSFLYDVQHTNKHRRLKEKPAVLSRRKRNERSKGSPERRARLRFTGGLGLAVT